MKMLFRSSWRSVLKCLLLGLAISATVVRAQDDDSVDQVEGGEDISPDEYKYFVALTSRTGQFRCSGALIADRFVATAAHCVTRGDAAFVDVSYYCVRRDNCDRPHEVIRFESFSTMPGGGDFALLTLEKVASIQPKIEPLVPDFRGKILKRLQRNAEMTLVGGGKSNDPEAEEVGLSEFVQELKVKYIPHKVCRKSGFSFKLARGFICSMPVQGLRSGPCQGDSGGPIIVRRNGRDHLVAVHSFGKLVCGAERRKPDGHYSVKAARKLLRSVICEGPYPAEWCGSRATGNNNTLAVATSPTAAPTASTNAPTPLTNAPGLLTTAAPTPSTAAAALALGNSSAFQVYWGVDLGDCIVTLNFLTLECVDPNATISILDIPPQFNPLVCPESTQRKLACDFSNSISFSEIGNLVFQCTLPTSPSPSYSSEVRAFLGDLRGKCFGFGNDIGHFLTLTPWCEGSVRENASGDLLSCSTGTKRTFQLQSEKTWGCALSGSCTSFGCGAFVQSLTVTYASEPVDSRCNAG